jgi:hypothetical protein
MFGSARRALAHAVFFWPTPDHDGSVTDFAELATVGV